MDFSVNHEKCINNGEKKRKKSEIENLTSGKYESLLDVRHNIGQLFLSLRCELFCEIRTGTRRVKQTTFFESALNVPHSLTLSTIHSSLPKYFLVL